LSRATALRASLAYCVDDPFVVAPKRAFVTEEDGVVVVREGSIELAGS
jgi:hypothetical protein